MILLPLTDAEELVRHDLIDKFLIGAITPEEMAVLEKMNAPLGGSEDFNDWPAWLLHINLMGGLFTVISTDWDTQGESHAG